jgi:CHASE2 domain-containing sensor protein
MDSLHLGLFISICILLFMVTAILIYTRLFPVIPCLIALVLSIILIYLNPAKLNYDKEINDAGP